MLDKPEQVDEANLAQAAATPIGRDEWVGQVEGRRRRRSGPLGVLAAQWERIPLGARYGLAFLLLLSVPPLTATPAALNLFGLTDNAFIVRTGARFLNFALLAVGLNVIVGYAGLLDLGYIAFYGIAGYAYAYLSSDFVTAVGPNGIHLPTLISLPLIITFTALVGWLLGVVSFRLAGDYLAIVTLGFGQIFVQLVLTATRVQLPWLERPVDLTRGPNGINNLDNFALPGYTFDSSSDYYFLFLALLVVVYAAVHHLNQSRIGRGWRAIKDDELAAEVMGIPSRRLKLMAFAIGAAIAALAGAAGAAWEGNVAPVPRYSVLTLINLYAMVVLGGVGSQPGVVLGALIFTVLPELLRSVALASYLFYGAMLLGLWAWVGSLRRFGQIVGAALAGGLLLKLLVNLLAPGLDGGVLEAGSALNQAVRTWLIVPSNFLAPGNVATVLCLFTLLLAIVRHGFQRWVLVGVTLYLAAFAWETRLAVEPAATRIIIMGATLVVLMISRPQGLLGKPEVRVV